MKKIFYVLVTGSLLMACVKKRNCQCVSTSSYGTSTNTYSQSYQLKGAAETECKSNESSFTDSDGFLNTTICTLK
jgi:hypothetical protein